jgi:hypothetical protein
VLARSTPFLVPSVRCFFLGLGELHANSQQAFERLQDLDSLLASLSPDAISMLLNRQLDRCDALLGRLEGKVGTWLIQDAPNGGTSAAKIFASAFHGSGLASSQQKEAACQS